MVSVAVRGTRLWRALGAGATLPLVVAAACTTARGTSTGNSTGATDANTPVVAKSHSPRPHPHPHPLPNLVITPASGSENVAPGQGLTVRSLPGNTITHVNVQTAGDPVVGTFNSDYTSWHSNWALGVSQTYTVTATGVDQAGDPVEVKSTFRTLTPTQTFSTQIFEGYMLTYGVGMPIDLVFSTPISDKAAVERALQLTTSKPVVGAWYWSGDQRVDFRPRTYWPAGTVVNFVGHFNGVEGAPGVYGYHTLTQSFVIGPSLIVVAGTQTHYMDVYYQGKQVYHWPISTGRATLPTPNGTYVTVNKANPQLMVGPGYRLEVPWSVRFTLSGDFLHAAPWSVGAQGFVNVSHGCVNMPPADAEIYYKMAVTGDPVTVTGSPAKGTYGDGFTQWFLSWDELLAGSATHEAVVAGPQGSTFVSPSSVPAPHATAPLETSPMNNWTATA